MSILGGCQEGWSRPPNLQLSIPNLEKEINFHPGRKERRGFSFPKGLESLTGGLEKAPFISAYKPPASSTALLRALTQPSLHLLGDGHVP